MKKLCTLALSIFLLFSSCLVVKAENDEDSHEHTSDDAEITTVSESNDNGSTSSGKCGDNLTWTLDGDGKLTISGKGTMTSHPWESSDVKTVEIQDGVTNIEDSAFYGCSNLTSISIPSSVTSIGSAAFYDCKRLASIEIPSSVTTIGENAFCNCNSLKSLVIPNSVTTLGDYAFSNCKNLTTVTLSNSVKTLYYPFNNCSNLTNIYFYGTENEWKNIADNVVNSTDTNITVHKIAYGNCGENGNNNVTWTLDEDGKLTISGTGEMFDFSLNLRAEWSGSKVKTVEIKEGVTTIGGYSFIYCTNLTDITIPSSVTEIGDYAFFKNNSLTNITIPSTVTELGNNAFSACENLKSIDIPSSITSIEMYTFSYCYNLESVTIPSTVTKIEKYAFYKCSELTSITIPSSVKTIEESTFEECTKLSSVTIPNSVTSIGNDAFKNCSELTIVNIPSSVTSVGASILNNCSKVTDIYYYGTKEQWDAIKENVLKDIGTNPTIHIVAGSGKCGDNLTWTLDGDGKLTISGTGTMWNYSNSNRPSWDESEVKTVEIKDGVTSIGDYALASCKSLTSIVIPDGVTAIGESAFISCENLTSVSLPCRFNGALNSTWFKNTKVTAPTIREHVLNNVAKEDATCTKDGYKEYWQCKKCQRMFSDENGTDEITTPIVIPATGHNFTNPTYTWSVDYKKCAAIRECQTCHEEEKETQTSTFEVVRNQSCTQSELTDYSVTFTNTAFKAQTKQIETANALGHKLTKVDEVEAKCETAGQETYWQCDTCKKMFSDENATIVIEKPIVIDALGHDYSKDWTVDEKPTCTKEGSKSHHCSRCDSKSDVTPIPKSDHNYDEGEVTKEPTCTETGIRTYKCKDCGATKEETIKALGHNLTKVDEVKATCTDAGQEAYWQCETCKKMFSDDKGTNEITAPAVIKALGHKLTKVDEVKATCADAGQKEYWQCSTCKKMFSDEKATIVIEKPIVIDALGHDYSKDWTVDEKPTCTKEGSKSHHCSRCDSKSDVTPIAKIAHNFEDPTYTWSNDYKQCQAKSVCKSCGALVFELKNSTSKVIQVRTCTSSELTEYSVTFTGELFKVQTKQVKTADALGHKLTKVEKVDATCTKDGQEAYWQCDTCKKMFSDDKGTNEITAPVVIKASHKYSEPTYTWSDEYKKCKAYRECQTCHEKEVEEQPSSSKVIRKQSCISSELIEYSVSFSNKAFKTQTKQIETSYALGHNLTKIERQEATVAKEGNITYWHCDRCKKYFADEGALKEITQADTIIPKVAPIIIKGDGVSITVGEKIALSFTSNALFADFKEVKLDNKVLDSKYYTVVSGSTVVTLDADYVASLQIGKHTLGIVSESGTASATFTVNNKEGVPSSEESSKSYSSNDKNKDGVVTCEEEMNSKNWTWSESKKACVYKVSNTSSK